MLALLLVIVIHIDHWPYQSSGFEATFWPAVDLLARVSVPLFVLLSGFLLAYGGQEHLPLRRFLRRRLGRSLVPWVIWLPVYTIVGCLITHEVQPTPAGVWYWWSLGGGHLWYLLLVPQLYIAYQVWPRSRWGIAVAGVLAVAVQIVLCGYRLLTPDTWPATSFLLAHGFQVAPLWIGYFGVGIALGRWWAAAPRRTGVPVRVAAVVAAVGGAVLLLLVQGRGTPNGEYATGTGAFLLPTLMPFTIAVFIAAALLGGDLLRDRTRVAEPIGAVSRYSLGIYIVHEALTYVSGPLQFLPAVSTHLGLAVLVLLVQVVITLGLAYVVSRLLGAGPTAITIGLPPEPLHWSRWRHPLTV